MIENENAVRATVIAKLFEMAPSTVYRMTRDKLIPSIAVGARGGGLRFYPSAVKAALERLAAARVNDASRIYCQRGHGKNGWMPSRSPR
jgi:hypothetical protein